MNPEIYDYFPMQKELKIAENTSLVVIAPVSAASDVAAA